MATLGQELISSDAVALAELVKNSYDADAGFVLIRVTGEVANDGAIEANSSVIQVLDDGHGMDDTTIINTWLEPATSFRRRFHRTSKGRRILGEKGVGRFAAAKLGDRLEMVSKAQEAEQVRLVVDWSAFEDETKYLDEVPLELGLDTHGDFDLGGSIWETWQAHASTYLDVADKPAIGHGTLLTITNLRSKWTADLAEEINNSLSRLVSPLDDERDIAQDFKIVLDLPEEFGLPSGVVTRPSLLQRPHYRLAADVDMSGSATVLMQLKTDVELEKDRVPIITGDRDALRCGPFEVFLNVWDRDASSLNLLAGELGDAKTVRSVLDSAAGVSIYRDGFRVLPFGERGDDWLELDHRRVQNPTLRLSNNQIVGYVLVDRDTNPALVDQTNREGLIDGPALDDLRRALITILSMLETERHKARPRRASAPRGGLLDRIDLRELQSAIAEALPEDSRIQRMVTDLQQSLDDHIDKVGQVLSRYHRLATLGQHVDRTVHEMAQPIVAIRQAAALEREVLAASSRQSSTTIDESLQELLDVLSGHVARIEEQSRAANDVLMRIAPFGGRQRGRPRRYVLEEALAAAVDLLRQEIISTGTEIRLPTTSHEVSLDGTEVQEILVNLLTNSLHWLKRVRRGSRVIAIDVARNSDKTLALIVEDSGPGIAESDRAHIFDPYFTTKDDGVGLGLSIAGEIASDYYDGDLELMSPGELGGARFRVTLRRRVE